MNKDIALKIENALTVGDIKKAIAELPDDMPVGSLGHFGEIVLFTELPDKQSGYLTAGYSWRDDNRETIEILTLPSVDHGPDPD